MDSPYKLGVDTSGKRINCWSFKICDKRKDESQLQLVVSDKMIIGKQIHIKSRKAL